MPHPQDVAVPSLPLSETLALAIKLGVANVDFEEQAEIDGFLHTFGNACYEAGRAAGRASAEPEGFVLVPREPTEAMLIAARDWSITKLGKAVGNDGATGCYAAMLAAAPTSTASIAPKAKCDPTQTECARCKNVITNCDGVFAAPKAEGEALHKFINAAAGEGLVLDGVDAADLYIELWPDRHRAVLLGGVSFDFDTWVDDYPVSITGDLYDYCQDAFNAGRNGPMCACGDRLAWQCDEAWGPNCDLGNNAKHARLAAPVAQAAAGASERERLRAAQDAAVMPLIGPLLDAWECSSHRLRDEFPELAKQLRAIDRAMEEADADRASGGGV